MTMLPLLCLAFGTTQDAPLIHSTFASGEDGWIAIQAAGTGAKVSVVHDADHVKVGTGSLLLNYTVGAGQTAGVALPVAEGAAAKMASIHFWVRPEQNTPLVVTLQEKEGAQYSCVFTANKDKWQEVEIGPQDFVPTGDPGAPADANGRLDVDQISMVTVLDLDQFLAQIPALGTVLGVKSGPRVVALADFQISSKKVVNGDAAGSGEYTFDTYLRPQPGWVALNSTANVVSEAPLNSKALRLDYNLVSGQVAAAFRRVKPGLLLGKTSLSLKLASATGCTMIVQLEEKSGGKYNQMVTLPSGSMPVDTTISLAGMKAADDSKDDDGKLDVDQVQQITILDVTAMGGEPGVKNTLWIGKVAAKG